jgi:hypothetical protein
MNEPEDFDWYDGSPGPLGFGFPGLYRDVTG